jgi:hypothetical protein
MKVIESKPNELVRFQLDFVKPYESSCTTRFEFKPEGDGTVVTWSMEGENGFMEKAVCMFMDMDAVVGGDFETGLASMKKVAEAASQ